MAVRLIASVPDDIEAIVSLVREQAPARDVVVVTGGLGGTPDDITREAIAAAFGVGQAEVPEVAEALRARFTRDPEYAVRWALLPGRQPPARESRWAARRASSLGNVYVLPGPADARWRRCSRRSPTSSRRGARSARGGAATGRPRAGSSACSRRWTSAIPASSSARTRASSRRGPEVEVVVKSSDPRALAAAATWIEPALEDATR